MAIGDCAGWHLQHKFAELIGSDQRNTGFTTGDTERVDLGCRQFVGAGAQGNAEILPGLQRFVSQNAFFTNLFGTDFFAVDAQYEGGLRFAFQANDRLRHRQHLLIGQTDECKRIVHRRQHRFKRRQWRFGAAHHHRQRERLHRFWRNRHIARHDRRSQADRARRGLRLDIADHARRWVGFQFFAG